MKANEFIDILKKGVVDFYKNIYLAIAGLILWIFIFAFSKLSVAVNHQLNNTAYLIAWLVLFALVSLAAMSFILSGLIQTSKEITKNKKAKVKDFLSGAKKFWLGNFLILIFPKNS